MSMKNFIFFKIVALAVLLFSSSLLRAQVPLAGWSFPVPFPINQNILNDCVEANSVIYIDGNFGSSDWLNTAPEFIGIQFGPGISPLYPFPCAIEPTSGLALFNMPSKYTMGQSIVFKISTLGVQNLVFSMDMMSAAPKMPESLVLLTTMELSWSVDGVNYNSLGEPTIVIDDAQNKTVDLRSVTALNNAQNVFIKATFNNFDYIVLDNISFLASPVVSLSTTWSGTAWSNGVPNATKDAIISGNYYGVGFTAKSLTVNANKTFKPSGKVKVLENFTNAGTTIMQGSGELNLQGSNTNTGIERLITTRTKAVWSYISSPIMPFKVSNTFATDYLYHYKETAMSPATPYVNFATGESTVSG